MLQNTRKTPQNTRKTSQTPAKHHKTHLLTKQPEFANKPALAQIPQGHFSIELTLARETTATVSLMPLLLRSAMERKRLEEVMAVLCIGG